MYDVEIYNNCLSLFDAEQYASENGCSSPDEGAIEYFKNEYPKDVDVDNDISVYSFNKPIGKKVGRVANGCIYLVKGKQLSYYCLIRNVNEGKMRMKKNKNIVKLNEAHLKKIVSDSVKKVLKESIFPKGPISQDGDETIQLNSAIHELKETISILEKFYNSGMNEKRLLEMAQRYCKRGMSLIDGMVSYAK